jgi:ferredoxin
MADCVECGACFDVCQVGALKIMDSFGWVDDEICVGCGQCSGACFHDAITMVRREYSPPPLNYGELAAGLIKGRKKAA